MISWRFLNFEAKEGTTIKKVLTKYKITEVKPGVHYTVNLGDIQSEVGSPMWGAYFVQEQRDILASLLFGPLKEEENTPKPVVTISLSYFNVITSTLESESKDATVSRPEKPSAQKAPPKEIDLQRNRIMVGKFP